MKGLLLLLVTLLFTSALGADVSRCRGKNLSSLERQSCQKEWTVLIYMAADNDLSAYALWDIYEMESQIRGQLNLGASTENVDVVVELDTIRNDGIKRFHISQGDEGYRSDLGFDHFDSSNSSNINSPLIEVLAEEDSVSAQERFQNFLSWGLKEYPSQKQMVVIWGHGEGFIGENYSKETPLDDLTVKKASSRFFATEEFDLLPFSELPDAYIFPMEKPFGGVGFDHSNKTFLTIPAIQSSFEKVKELGLLESKVDILAFDACLMQSLEVMSQLTDNASYLIGSNQIQNYLGLPYRMILDRLNQGIGANGLAREIPNLTKESWERGGYQRQIDEKGFHTFSLASLSSWHIDEIILPELNTFSQKLIQYLDEKVSRQSELMYLIENAPRFQGEMMDLSLFYGLVEKMLWLERLAGEETQKSVELKKFLAYASEGIGQTVLNATFGPLYYEQDRLSPENSYLLGFFKGVSIWLPKSARHYELRFKEMGESRLHKRVSAWNRVLEKLYKNEIFLFDLGSL